MNRVLYGLGLGLMLGVGRLSAAEAPRWGGYLESRLFLLDGPYTHPQTALWNRLMLELRGDVNPKSQVVILMRGSQLSGFMTRAVMVNDTNGYVQSAIPAEQLLLDRMYIETEWNRWRIRAGKQLISWSFGYLFTPLDIYNPTYMLEPGFEVPGIAAWRSLVRLSRLSNWELICIPDGSYTQSKMTTRLITNIRGTDIALNWLHNGVTDLAGLAVKGELGIGYWVESAWYYRSANHRLEGCMVTTMGLDYTFAIGNGCYWMLEYFHDQTGFPAAEYATSRYTAMTEGRAFMGRNYAAVLSSYPLSNRVSLSGAVVLNLDDQASVWVPQIEYRAGVNLSCRFGAYLNPSAIGSEFAPSLPAELRRYQQTSQVFCWIRSDF